MNTQLQGQDCVILTSVFNDWPSVSHLLPELDRILSRLGLRARAIVIDDASTDEEGVDALHALELSMIESIDVVRLASNQGNQRAIAIGVAYIARNLTTDYLLVLDSDFEDKPEDVPILFEACRARNDNRIVFAERSKRSEGQTFRAFYFVYKWLNRLMTGTNISIGNFSVIPGHLVRRLAHVAALWAHFPASIIRAGIPHSTIPSARGVRRFGHGKMNIVKLIVHGFSSFAVYADVIAVRIMLFAAVIALSFLAALAGGTALWFSTDILIPGWTSQMMIQILILFAVVLGTATVVLFTALSLRIHPQMIPFHDHGRFIFEVVRCYPVANQPVDMAPLASRIAQNDR